MLLRIIGAVVLALMLAPAAKADCELRGVNLTQVQLSATWDDCIVRPIGAQLTIQSNIPAFAEATPAPAPAPAVQNTVTTTGPVSSDTTISIGTLAGQVLDWVWSAFGVSVGGVLTWWITNWARKAGVEVTQGMSEQLDRTLVNGLNIAAARAAEVMQGKGKIEVSNDIVKGAVAYAQDHRADTIKALGLDPKSGKAVEALNARIATLITDPSVPTPPILDPAAAAAKPLAGVPA